MAGFTPRNQAEEQRTHNPKAAYDKRWQSTINIYGEEAVIGTFPTRGFPPAAQVQNPLIYRRHSHAAVQVNGRDCYNTVCLKPDYCPLCELAAAAKNTRKIGDANASKYLKQASDRAVFRFLSTRVVFLKQEGDRISRIPERKNPNGVVCDWIKNRGFVPCEGGVHPLANQFPWTYEGLTGIDVSYTEMKPQAQAIYALADGLEGVCGCLGKVPEGLTQRQAKLGRAANGALVCEVGCGNPRAIELEDCFVRVSVVGEGTAKDYKFERFDPVPMPEDIARSMLNDKGQLEDIDWSVFKGEFSLVEQVVRALAPGMRQYGLNAEQYLTGQAGGGSTFGGFSPGGQHGAPPQSGGLPSFGAPGGGPGQGQNGPPRHAAPPAAPFPAGTLGAPAASTTATPPASGVPTATVAPSGAPLAAGQSMAGPKAGPPPAAKLTGLPGFGQG